MNTSSTYIEKNTEENEQTTIVTSALPYVNNIPHLGNMVCIISADVYTRYLRLIGKKVISILGTDEHGSATQIKALEEGKTPQEICDTYYDIHKKIYEWFNTDFDCFGRTSSKENAQITIDIYAKLKANGYIFEKETMQYFDEKAQLFLPDRFVEGTCPHCAYTSARGDQCDSCGKLLEPHELLNPISQLSKTTPILRKSTHLYLDLPKLHKPLEEFILSKQTTWSPNAVSIAKSWLTKLEPRCITRDLSWGIPVPDLPGKVFYCWFDAPIGYIGITAEHKKEWYELWHNPQKNRLVQFLGKDNIAFHTILFPAFLLGTHDNYTLLNTISANEYLNYADGKFSKSKKTGVFGDNAIESGIPADAYRFYLIANRPELEDTVFDWDDFGTKVNKELIDNFCNLVHRVCSLIHTHYSGVVLPSQQKIDTRHIIDLFEKIQLKDALKAILGESKKLNAQMQQLAPWNTVKTQPGLAHQQLSDLLHQIRDISILISPIIPKVAEQIFSQLHIQTPSIHQIGKEITLLTEPKPLVQKIPPQTIQDLRAKYMSAKRCSLDLRVATILKVNAHLNAQKLYVLDIDVGSLGTRTIVSGLVPYFTPEQLIGKSIIIVSNLAPATIRGVQSNGMLLGAQQKETPDKLSLLSVKFSKPGEQVYPAGYSVDSSQVTIDMVKDAKLTVEQGQVLCMGKQLQTAKERIICEYTKANVS
jgi:methionyl-tRNA synthetase